MTCFPSSNMNSSIIKICLWNRKRKLYGENVTFSNLTSLVALRVCFSLQDNSDAPFIYLFYLILYVKFEQWKQEMKTRKLYRLFHLYIVSFIVLILHYNGLPRSPSVSRFDQSLIKGHCKWYTFIEVRLIWISLLY